MMEERKLFVGGLPRETRDEDLRGHFARYGEVVDARVRLEPESGRSRGFGFVEFADEAATLRALAEEEKPNHVFYGRMVDVKRAKQRHVHKRTEQSLHPHNTNQDPNVSPHNNQVIDPKKLFVGGLRDHITEEDFRNYFERFGTITDVVVMRDKITNIPRGFGFISFDSNEAVSKVLESKFHNLNGNNVEVKIAVQKNQVPDGHKYNGSRNLAAMDPSHYYGGMSPSTYYPLYHSPYYPGDNSPYYPVDNSPYYPVDSYFSTHYMVGDYGTPIMAMHSVHVMYSGYGHGRLGYGRRGYAPVDTNGRIYRKSSPVRIDQQKVDIAATISTESEPVKSVTVIAESESLKPESNDLL